MTRVRRRSLVLAALVVGVLTWFLVRVVEGRGGMLPAVSWLVVVLEVALAGAVLVLGWGVRQYVRGRRPGLSGLRAARTLVLAKAAAWSGSILLGWYGGQAARALRDVGLGSEPDRAESAGAAAAGALVLVVCGLVTEWWCRVPPVDDEHGGTRAPRADAPLADSPPTAG